MTKDESAIFSLRWISTQSSRQLEQFAAARQQILSGRGFERIVVRLTASRGDQTQNVEIVAEGRGDWIGWVELAKEAVDETATRMTARVIQDIGADILGLVEVEDRPALVRFNRDLLSGLYRHVMLVDGNDDRGIDGASMTRDKFEIESIRSNVDKTDAQGIIFSRDCAEYEVRTPNGAITHVLVNHFKSQSGAAEPSANDRQKRFARSLISSFMQGRTLLFWEI
jgi:hypothetical protein